MHPADLHTAFLQKHSHNCELISYPPRYYYISGLRQKLAGHGLSWGIQDKTQMRKFFKFFTRTDVAPPGRPDTTRQRHLGVEPEVKRELVPIALKFVMRQAGIPMHWLSCGNVINIQHNMHQSVSVQIVIKHWDERLLSCIVAIQHELGKALDLFDPSVDHSNFEFSWAVDGRIQSPRKSLPDKSTWASPGVSIDVPRINGATGTNSVGTIAVAPAAIDRSPILSPWDHRSPSFADTDML